MQQIEQLVGEIEQAADPHLRAQAIKLVELLMEMHGTGIEQMLSIVQNTDKSAKVLPEFSSNELVSSLLLLYGLHPVAMPARVEQALQKVRPYLATHGGSVELVQIDEQGLVTLRLQGSCHGCPSSEMTLKNAIEEAIFEFAPDVGGLHVEGVVKSEPSAAQLVQIS